MLKNLHLTLLILFATAFPLWAANYYVTQGGSGSKDGSSAANAWDIGSFNGSSKPTGGDTVTFSGNFSSSLTPSSNGTGSARLTLDCKAASFSNTVNLNSRSNLTISGGATTPSFNSTALNIGSCTNVTVDGWTANYSDANGWPVFVSLNRSTNVTISNANVLNCGYGFVGDVNTGILISGCIVVTSANGTNNKGNQTDIVHFGGGQNITIEKCKLVLKAPGSGGSGSDGSYRHNDCIQTYANGGSSGRAPNNWTLRYNWIENANTSGDGNSSQLMVEAEGGYFKIYDNVFICPENATGIGNGVHMGSGQSQSDQHIFYNNTVIKKKYAPGNAISYNDANKPAGQGNGTLYCVNNIAFAGLGGKDQGSTSNNLKVGKISNNFFYNFGNYSGSVPTIPPGPGGSGNTDPGFNNYANNDFSLGGSSTIKGKGDNSLGSDYAAGIAPGATWPNPALVTRTGAWDPGAFVSNGGPAPSPTPTPAPTPPPPDKFAVGDYVSPTTTVNIRSAPAGTLVGTHDTSDVGVVKSGPTVANFNGAPVNWYEIDWQTAPDGWAGDDNLSEAAAPSPTPTPSTPTPSPSPTPTPGPSPSPSPGSPTYEKWIENQNNWIRSNPPTPDAPK